MKKAGSTILAIVLFIIIVSLFLLKPYYDFLTKTVGISIIKTLLSSNSIKKVNDNVNILILGIPGGKHDGPNLSDSIIVANYDLKKNRVVTISIPRDVWSDTLRDKINSAYAYGESKVRGGGLKLARAEIAAVVDLPIQYAAVIDFSNFKDLVDYVGGVDIAVKRGFTDNKFPLEGKENDLCDGDLSYKCRYESISFNKGKQHMNGATALKFVRSRNAEDEEGSDFARNQRQQEAMAALKEKMVKIVKSLNIQKIKGLYHKLDALVTRDISNQQSAILLKKIIFQKDFYQKNFHLSQNMFEIPDYRLYDGKYVLIPPDTNFNEIHKYVKCLLDKEDELRCSYSKK